MKDQILESIRRTAEQNGGRPLGWKRFEQATGIRYHHWFGKYWKSWGDAVAEAGLVRNTLQMRIEDDQVLSSYAVFVRELGKVPVKGDLRLRRKADPTFPNDKIFERYGSKAQLLATVRAFCIEHPEWSDILSILPPPPQPVITPAEAISKPLPLAGFVYLIHSGKYHKIGHTNSVGRREYELGIQLPEEVTVVHRIETDDPEGIEDYWHRRFAAKRARGEWFKLDASDVAAFKRRKFQ
jgi:hypothetical protein